MSIYVAAAIGSGISAVIVASSYPRSKDAGVLFLAGLFAIAAVMFAVMSAA
jgi:hypothetical protein